MQDTEHYHCANKIENDSRVRIMGCTASNDRPGCSGLSSLEVICLPPVGRMQLSPGAQSYALGSETNQTGDILDAKSDHPVRLL
jgi:hypothetical protein